MSSLLNKVHSHLLLGRFYTNVIVCVFVYKFIRMLLVIMFMSSFIIKIHFQCLHNSSISVVYLALLNMVVLFTGIQPCQTVSLLLILQLYFFILSTRICTEYCSFPFGPCSTDFYIVFLWVLNLYFIVV